MSAVWLRGRAVARRRWRAWTALGVVLGIFGGVTIALAEGAHSSNVAYGRFVKAERAAHVVLAGKSEFGLVGSVDLEQVARLPQVAYDARAFVGLPFSARVNNGRLLGVSDLFPVASADERLGHTIEGWKMLHGRRADPNKLNEATASFELARRLHVRVGDTVSIHFYDARLFGTVAVDLLSLWPARLRDLRDKGEVRSGDPANGPDLRFTVVGIEASPLEFPPLLNDLAPVLHLTPAFERVYAARVAGSPIAYLRMHNVSELPAFQIAVERMVPDQPVSFISTLPNQQPKVQRSIHAEAIVLAILAALVAFAGVVALAQALTRQGFAEAGDDETLRSLGMGSGQLFALAMLRSGVIALVAGGVACLVGWLLAPSILLSLASKANLDHGFPVNAFALLVGGAAVVGFALSVGAISALLARGAARRVRTGDDPSRHGAGHTNPLRQPWLPLPVVVGVRFTTQRARRSPPLWTAVIGIAFCVAMLTFATTFTAHLHRGLSEEHRYGWNWDVKIGAPALPDLYATLVPGLRAQPGVTDVSAGFVTQMEVGAKRVDVLGLDRVTGNAQPTILAGRAPSGSGDIALGARSIRELHTRLGQQIDARLGAVQAHFTVVGQAVFPEFGDRGQLGTGAWTTMAGVRRLLTNAPRNTFLVRMHGAHDVPARVQQLTAALAPLPSKDEARPEDLVNLSRGDGLLEVLGVLLGLLALAMLVHAVVTAVRNGRGSHATLRALGFTRAQSALTILSQSLTVAVAALLIGVPLGLLTGRWVWHAYADRLGVASDSFVPHAALLLAILATIALAFVGAIVPGWLVTHTKPADALRAPHE